MPNFYSISTIFLKKSVVLARGISLLQTLNTISFKKFDHQEKFKHGFSVGIIGGDPSDLPAKSPPEVPTAPRMHKAGTPLGLPRRMISIDPEFNSIIPIEGAAADPWTPPKSPADSPTPL